MYRCDTLGAAVEIFPAVLAALWKAFGGFVTLFIGLWLASKPVKWLEEKKKREMLGAERIALDGETLKALQEINPEIEGQLRESEAQRHAD